MQELIKLLFKETGRRKEINVNELIEDLELAFYVSLVPKRK